MRILFLLFAVFLLFSKMANAQGVGINQTGNDPEQSAGLDIDFQDKGFLLPRLSTEQRDQIATPASTLLIFNTSVMCFQAYLSGQWQNVYCDHVCTTAPSSPEGIIGNASPCQNQQGLVYSINPVPGANSYTWTVPSDALITSGQGSTSIVVNIGYSEEAISVVASNNCGASSPASLPLTLGLLPEFVSINGIFQVCADTPGMEYTVNPEEGVTYTWSYSGNGFELVSGQGTGAIVANYLPNATNGTLNVSPSNACGQGTGYGISVNIGGLVGTFGTNGAVTENPSNSTDIVTSLATDETGLYVAGYDIASGVRWRVQKRDVYDGSILWTQIANLSSGGQAKGISVDATGLYVVGLDQQGANQWRIEKRDLNTGAEIWTQSENPSPAGDSAEGIIIDNSNMYIAGYESSSGNDGWRIQKRLLSDGTVVWSQNNNLSSGSDQAFGITQDASGIYIAGYDSSPGNRQWRIEKRSAADGTLMWTQSSNPSNSDDEARAIVVDETGVYIAGYDQSPGNYQWRIEKRDLDNGSLIWSISSNPTSGVDIAFAMAINETALYVGGYDGTSGRQWRMEKRNLSTGSLINQQTSNPSGGADEVYGMTMHESGVFLGGYDSAQSNARWRIEKRCR